MSDPVMYRFSMKISGVVRDAEGNILNENSEMTMEKEMTLEDAEALKAKLEGNQ